MNEPKEKNISKDFLILSILTVISVTVWIILDVYHALNKSEIPQVLKQQTEPINPNLDLTILDELEKLTYYDWSEYQAPPTPAIQPATEATSESEINLTEPSLPNQGTESGQTVNQ